MPEHILEPSLPICDAHHHLWDRKTGYNPSRYLIDELLDDTETGHRIESTVYVEAGIFYSQSKPEPLQPVGEVEFAAGVAAMAESGKFGAIRVCAAIVGHANMELGDSVADVLAQLKAAGGGRLAGVRHMAAWHESPDIPAVHTHPSPNLYAEERFRQAFAQLAKFDLSFDAFQWHTQIANLTDLAREFPETKIALNHLGSPIGIGPYRGKREEVFAAWAASIRDLAACPNVLVKLGGMGLRVSGFGFNEREEPARSDEIASAWLPYFETCIDAFSPDRAMFESNFPVDRISCSYDVLWNAFKRIASGYSSDEKARMFKDTAEEFYCISPSVVDQQVA